jgi:hypothetical protein
LRQVWEIGVTNRITYHYHLNRKSPLLGIGKIYPRGGVPSNLKGWETKVLSPLSLVIIDRLGWFSLMSTLEASLVETFGSPIGVVKELDFE